MNVVNETFSPPTARASANTTDLRCTRAFVAAVAQLSLRGVGWFVDRSASMSGLGSCGKRSRERRGRRGEDDGDGTEGETVEGSRSRPLFPRRGERLLPSVGLLARGSMMRALPLPRGWRRRRSASSGAGDCFPTDSGGTAPAFHRSSLLRPDGHRKHFLFNCQERDASSLVLRRVSRRTASSRATDRCNRARRGANPP